MTTKKTLIFSVLCLLHFACRHRPHKDIPGHPDWIWLTLPNGWTLQAPKNFKDSSVIGIDSDPGFIYSISDSITLEYDSGGNKPVHKPDCDFEREAAEEKKSDMSSFYKQRTGVDHIQNIDTIGDRVASIITSTQIGKGVTQLSIQDCSTGASLGITGHDLSAEKRTLVLEMFRTTKMQSDKK